MTEEKRINLAELYEQSLKDIQEGQVIKGTIVGVTEKEVLIDVGYKSEGIVLKDEFPDPALIKIGEQTEVLVEVKEDDEGRVILSKEKAEKMQGWQRITENFQEKDLTEGKVRRKVKGGYMVEIFGIEGFLPNSLSFFKGFKDEDVLSKVFKFQIAKLNTARRSLILSRKDAVLIEKEKTRARLWDELKKGDLKTGTVKSITDFGAFIDLGGIDGLLHITDMSWSRISHPSEMLAVGDKIEVVILDFNREACKISLGLKQKTPDPWQEVATKFPVDMKTKGKVVNIMPYGIFVELEKGIEGLVHSSEISWQKKIINPKDLFAIGDSVEVQILNIDRDAKRISLSIRQLEANPWLEAEKKFPVETQVTGKVRGFTDYGAFIELDANLEGMIHVSDMSWTKKVNNPQDVLRKGQKVDVKVMNIDVANRKISLGLKQLQENPWPEIAKKYPVGATLETEVVQVTGFGVFVRLEDNLEGLVYSSEIEKSALESLKPQDKLAVTVIKVDVEQMKIGLSAKLSEAK
ncbi:30S ribosomal protein S1 [Candidatus Omnitrophota bacterium]